jgi:protocatechuate 3,4-dioxygenase beta subunit
MPPAATLAPAAKSATVEPPAVEAAATSTPQVTELPVINCTPTPADALGPFYVPNAPVRDKVGEGYVLSGVVRSADGCAPIPDATIEIWMAGPDGNYADEYRATLFSDENGAYRFESHIPPPYSGRPPHHHLRVTAEGFQTLVTQNYPLPNQTEAAFDLVLLPE